MNGFLDGALLFGGILAALYAVTVAVYFILGFGISWMNDRNPERRIQKGRFGEKRRQAEIRQSMASILVTCLSVAIGIFAQLQGWTITPWDFSWWTALPLFLLTMVLFDAWFYFAHRALHTKPLYKYHALHHKSVAPTAWSNDSIGLVDTALSQGFYAVVVFIVPIPPVILLAHRAFDQINGTFGHAGFEYFASKTARYPSPMLCTTYHDQHHAEFRFNYANYFSFWDRVMGTISPVYDQRVESFEATQAPLSLKRPAEAAKEKAAS
ncbi:sterol desaturase family protein [Rhizobium sp. SG2393]|uniref:sterol desaturase family protein n=1 Tax=Rhizobium sp. SG2393 TaxID=3276279 RepID=UPI00366E0F05